VCVLVCGCIFDLFVYLLSVLNYEFSFMSHIVSNLVNIFELHSVAECCRALQSVAECYRVLQRVAACCRVWQSVAVCRSVSQCVAVCCSVLQCVAVRICVRAHVLHHQHPTQSTQLCANTLQHTATHCNTLPHTATNRASDHYFEHSKREYHEPHKDSWD